MLAVHLYENAAWITCLHQWTQKNITYVPKITLPQKESGKRSLSGNRKWCLQTGSRQSTPYRRYGPDTEIQYRLKKATRTGKNPAEFSPKRESRYGNFSIDPTSSIRTSIADAIFADAISETPSLAKKNDEKSDRRIRK